MIATKEQRRAHAGAIKDRATWRKRYCAVSLAIRAAKSRISTSYRSNSIDHESMLHLTALRFLANEMMTHRDWIKDDLRATAYTYATAEELAAA